MSFWAYLYLLRASCRKFFNSKEALATNKNNSEFLNEMNGECKHALQEKCQKAAIEIQHISHFSHWPVAKAKGDTQKNSLVYLGVKRNKRDPVEQRNKRVNNSINITKKITFELKSGTAKKLPDS
ncbi:MAG: hypothetical protein GY928_22840 [Colwellia sp.]|nr:hypothetical protein [Colwellia sp.]